MDNMSTQALIYEKSHPLSKERHSDWSVEVGQDFGYARELTAVPLMAAEFFQAAKEFPIAFVRNQENVQPVAVLGVRGQENLFLDKEGRWKGRYLPAFLRRYPFIFARSEDGKTFALCIDEAFHGFNQEGRGEALFTDEGEITPYVSRVLEFLKAFQLENSRTLALCKKLDDYELLESKNAVWKSPEGESATLTGFFLVNQEKLRALPAKLLGEMVKTGEMDVIYAHLSSIANFNEFRNRLAPSTPAPQTPLS